MKCAAASTALRPHRARSGCCAILASANARPRVLPILVVLGCCLLSAAASRPCVADGIPTCVRSWGNYSGETWGLAADSQGALYVPDTEHQRVDKYDADGQLLLSIGGPGGPGRFALPYWVAVNSHDEVLVLDAILRTIQIFDVSGNYLGTFVGYQPGTFQPVSMELDANDNLYVTEFNPSRVDPPGPTVYRLQKYSSAGIHLLDFDLSTCSIRGCLRSDSHGGIYGDSDGDQLVRFSEAGACLSKIGATGTGPAQFRYPAGFDLMGDNTLVCVDSGNRRVQLLTLNGEFLGAWNTAGPEGDLVYPLGALVVGQAVYITDRQRIHKFSFGTTPVRASSWGRLKSLYR